MFDEIEKAHSEVFNLLLQILDDGRLTDSQGRMINFKNTIIIMTSNLGSDLFLEGHPEKVKVLIQKTFRPELINRIDEIVYFNPLDRDTQLKIVDKMLLEVAKVLQNQYISVEFTNAVKQHVLDEAYSPEYGARPIKRFIQKEVETVIAKAIVRGDVDTKNKYLIDFDSETSYKIIPAYA